MDIKSLIAADEPSGPGKSYAPVTQNVRHSHGEKYRTHPDGRVAQQYSSRQDSMISPRSSKQSPSKTMQPLTLSHKEHSLGDVPANLAIGPSTPMTPTPTTSTPGSVTTSWHRPGSSHSASTPNSAQYAPPNMFHMPSQPSAISNGVGVQHAQSMSPQFGAPQGPPPLRPRPSLERQHISPAPQTHIRNSADESRRQQLAYNKSPFPPETSSSFSSPQSSARANPSSNDTIQSRQDSISISPKTKMSSIHHLNQHSPSDLSQIRNGYPNPTSSEFNPHLIQQSPGAQVYGRQAARRSSSMGIDSMLNAAPEYPHTANQINTPKQPEMLHQTSPSLSFATQPKLNSLEMSQQISPPLSLPQTKLDGLETAPHSLSPSSRTFQASTKSAEEVVVSESPKCDALTAISDQPARKKVCRESSINRDKKDLSYPEKVDKENASAKPQSKTLNKPPRLPMPIWAQSVRANNKTREGRGRPQEALQNNEQRQNAIHIADGSATPPHRQQPEKEPLGPWEPNILNTFLIGDVTKVVSDFLMFHVIQNQNVGTAPLGGAATKGGAILEIEAKLGRLIDKNTTDRLRLPVLTESVFNRNDPNYRVGFESSMTEKQHRVLNEFLNDALKKTLAPKLGSQQSITATNQQRLRMHYSHTKEVDTFYNLTQQGLLALPASFDVRSNKKVKVRVTHDQKTGKELAKIVKVRVADLDVYSPCTQVDWRISVNIEMDFQGDTRDLIETDKRAGNGADRYKDRLSYKHQAYRIDLTQVASAESSKAGQKEHELEIEVSSEDIRHQGTLLQKDEPNQYVDLVSGFVDNIRTLARRVPVDNAPLPAELR